MDWTRHFEIKTLTCMFCILSICMNLGDCSVCTDEAKRLSLPVVSFCSDDQASGNPVILDGYHLNTLKNVNNCTCVAKAPFVENTLNVIYQNIDSIFSPVQSNLNCGSKVLFMQSQVTQERRCQIGGFFSINTVEDVYITLIKEEDPEDTRYCFKFNVDSGDTIKLVCHISDTYELTTNDHGSETMVVSTLGRNINHYTALQTTDIQSITTQNARNNSFQFTKKVRYGNTGSSTKVYIGIGGGTVALLTVLIVGIVCLQKTRQRKRQSVDNNEQTGDNDEFGLQYNTLYVSADDPAISQTTTNQETSLGIHSNKVAYEVEGNYSETTSFKHVLAPGDERCEYAVVDKQNKDSIRNDVYAIVNKTSERNSK